MFTSERPRIKFKLTRLDKTIEAAAFLALVFQWVLTISGYSDLPEIIPIHFNALGTADGYGSKSTILILPVMSTVLFTGITILSNFPHLFNYPTEITEENAERQYRLATRLMRFMKLAVIVVFALIDFKTQEVVSGKSEGLGKWFLPFTLGMTFIPIIVYLIKSFRTEK